MEYEQLERCYKTVLSQRDRYHDQLVDAEIKIENLEAVIDKAKVMVDCGYFKPTIIGFESALNKLTQRQETMQGLAQFGRAQGGQ